MPDSIDWHQKQSKTNFLIVFYGFRRNTYKMQSQLKMKTTKQNNKVYTVIIFHSAHHKLNNVLLQKNSSEMSRYTAEWHLKRENSIKYWIDIDKFSKKKKWRSGKEIYSKNFKISESVFAISIYPNGHNEEEVGHVSVFLENKSDHRVKCSAKFSLKDHEKNLEAHYYQAQDTWGLGEFVSHDTIEWDSLLDEEDDRFTLQIEVDLMEEEVLATRPREIQGSAVARLQKEVSDLREAISKVHNETAKISILLVGKIEELQRGMERIEKKMDPLLSAPSLSVS